VTIEQDRNVLAGEYVLGTLDSYAQAEAQALMALDPEFAAIVRAWERRLGELSAMVSPVEPPNKTWDRIKSEIAKIEAERAALAGPEKLAPTPEPEKPALDPPGATVERTVTPAVPAPEPPRPVVAVTTTPPADALAATGAVVPAMAADAAVVAAPATEATSRPARAIAAADANVLRRRIGRWRAATLVAAVTAAALAALIVLREVDPAVLPPSLQPEPKLIEVIRSVEVPSPTPAEFVAVLQKEADPPAFLMTLDWNRRVLTVRNLGAERQAGMSYELWLVSEQFPAPRSLGMVGQEPYTVLRTLGDYDAATVNRATFAVSVEAQAGSPTGRPTGPFVYSGKLVQTTVPSLAQTP
jgi:anti-sigma-K factor RskA